MKWNAVGLFVAAGIAVAGSGDKASAEEKWMQLG